MESVTIRVNRGVKWLDENQPGWHKYVATGLLQMENTCRCVLGQAFEYEAIAHKFQDGYTFVHKSLSILQEDVPDEERWSVRHGFDAVLDHEKAASDYRKLQEEWIRVIKARRPAVVTV